MPAQSFASLTGRPTTIAGYGITDAFDGAYSSLTGTPTIPTNNNQLTNGSGYLTSVPAQTFTSLTGKPTTLAGYGITDAFDGAFGSLTGKPNLFSTVASSGQNDINADGTSDKLYIEAGAGIGITTDENTDTLTITATGGSGLSNVVEDTSPQLGGNLDMNGFEIVTTAGGHIRLDPDTTGGVGIGNVTNPATLLHLQQSAPIITIQLSLIHI